MLRSLLFLTGMLFAFSVHAVSNEALIKNLRSRFQSLSDERGSLIKSYTNHNQSYIYDQALAIIAFTKENDQQSARALLKGLKSLQMKDGSLYFSYYMDGTSPYPIEGDKRISGAMSWVALAATHYQSKFKSKEFYQFNYKLLSYLHSEIVPLKVKDQSLRALRFAPADIASTPFLENDTVALEHNLDAYAAFLHFSRVNKFTKWNSDVLDLKAFILSMWDKSNSHFWSGTNIQTGKINTSELYLDNQSWSLLALDSETLKEISPEEALKLNCEMFLVNHNGVHGFYDSRPTRGPASDEFVWSEGTLGQILAMKKLKTDCKEVSSNEILTSVQKMKKKDNGIAYATLQKKDFTNASSVAGTAWMYFAANDFNPFQLEGLN